MACQDSVLPVIFFVEHILQYYSERWSHEPSCIVVKKCLSHTVPTEIVQQTNRPIIWWLLLYTPIKLHFQG